MDLTNLEFEKHKYRMILNNVENLEDAKKIAQTLLDAYFDMKMTYMNQMGQQILNSNSTF